MDDIRPAIIVKNAVEQAIPEHGDFTSREVAEKALAWLEEHAPEHLSEWQHDLALGQLREVASHTLAKRRAEARQLMRAEKFDNFVAAVRAGENPLSQMYVIDDSNTRRQVGDMTNADLSYVATSYGSQAARLSMEAMFFKQLAKQVPTGKTVKDVISDEEFTRLYQSITQESV
jgi:hypothetical protein